VTAESYRAWKERQPETRQAWLETQNFDGAPGSVCALPDETGAFSAFVAGIDAETPLWSYAGLPSRLPDGGYRVYPEPGAKEAEALALGWLIGSYRFRRYKTKDGPAFPRLVKPKNSSALLPESLAEAVHLVRDLINTPANDMGPAELAAAARRLGRRFNARVTVTSGKALLSRNYPLIHAVGRASRQEPRLIDLRWGNRGPNITLVGKGVCFDSGGLDLKPAAGMRLMKKDMGGGAHVLGLAQAIMATKLPVRLRVLVPAVENAVSGDAFRPLDVLPSRKGLTIEIGNTDAEGRLILADALAEACRAKPDLVLDFATLTGAARVALGTELPALFANDDDLAKKLLAAADDVSDPLWRLPLHRPYRSLLESGVADLNNISSGSFGGAITAALFLEHFVEPDIPWAHIDLMAWNLSSRPGRPEGGEAMGLRAAYALIRAMTSKG
jgi:leucyl aminopeptidase